MSYSAFTEARSRQYGWAWALGTWPRNHLAQATLVWAALAQGRPAEALDRARTLSAGHSRAPAYRHALAVLDEAAECGPLTAVTTFHRARAQRSLGRQAEARVLFEQVAGDAEAPGGL